MKLIIHRGTQEIGGSCVELKTRAIRLLIDFGIPLTTTQNERFDSKVLLGKSIEELKALKILPQINGLYRNQDREVDAILISHAHLDHYGLLNYVHPDIPVYMSQGAEELIEISNIFTPNKLNKINIKVINNKKPFNVGDVKITPYLVDHSAFDALAYLVEAEGKRLFYSGDFRGHGRKSKLFKKMLQCPPKDIDCLLMEGSSLGRNEVLYQDEISVEKRIAEVLKEADNITFLFTSSQNIDRLVSAYKACLKADKIFVIDIYTAYILDRLSGVSKHLPQFNWRNMRVKFYKNQADTLAQKVSIKKLYSYNAKKIEIDEISEKKDRILMLSRDNSLFPRIIKGISGPRGAKIIYSMWEGYLTDEFRQYCKDSGLVLEEVHTSGHASIEDLQAFAHALDHRILIPIHTLYRNRYKELFDNVRLLEDGETFEV
ncbi:MAG: MBL fold metallo-hydrolase [Candidatus Omnitrophota bacterium]